MDVSPGQRVAVEIAQAPRCEAARKTLLRVCAKDPQVAKLKRLRKRDRPSWQTWQRGGRFWHHQMRSKPPVSLKPGATYNLRATVDVIRDLKSVSRWVKVTGA